MNNLPVARVIRDGNDYIVTLSCLHSQLLSARGAARALREGGACAACDESPRSARHLAELVAQVYETTLEAMTARRVKKIVSTREIVEARRAAALAMRWTGASTEEVGRVLGSRWPRNLLTGAYRDKAAVAEANGVLAMVRR